MFIPDTDYRSRTPIEVKNPRWKNPEHTILDVDVLFEELSPIGFIPFSTHDFADTEHGIEIWEKATSGEYGNIAEYEPPDVEVVRANMPILSRRQFWLGANSLGLSKADVMAAVDDPIILIEIEEATEFHRTYESVVMLSEVLGITPEQIDDVWMWWASA
ncbi:hypothetical protein IPU75_12240 [Ochrobactrum sp. SD129]|nr:hypothetical protein [Ochrobactrum sp. SD129]